MANLFDFNVTESLQKGIKNKAKEIGKSLITPKKPIKQLSDIDFSQAQKSTPFMQ
jgi:hypothetical protein